MRIRDLAPWKHRRHRELAQRNEGASFRSLQREMNELLDSFFDGWGEFPVRSEVGELAFISPRVDISESDNSLEVTAELPGIDEKDIDVSLAHGVLTIRGQKKFEKEEKDKTYYRMERSFGEFHRDIPLPVDVDEDKVEATFNKGVLTITLPKAEQGTRKKITVSRAG